MKYLPRVMFALACAAMPVAASAGTTEINFDSIGDGSALWDGPSYTEADLTFTATAPSGLESISLASWADSDTKDADPDGRTIFANFGGQFLSFGVTDGGLFDLTSIDLADLFNAGGAGSIYYSYTIGGVTTSSFFTPDNSAGLQTFYLNLSGLSSFSIEQGNPGFQLDNVVYSLASDAPEPGTWAMMLIGFAAIGGAMRGRRKSEASPQLA